MLACEPDAPEFLLAAKVGCAVIAVEDEDVADAAALQFLRSSAPEPEWTRGLAHFRFAGQRLPLTMGVAAFELEFDAPLVGGSFDDGSVGRFSAVEIDRHGLSGPRPLARHPKRDQAIVEGILNCPRIG